MTTTIAMAHRYERGQTLPVWILSILVAFSLAFFMYNYSNTVRYQVRAQNAADSAAAAALGQDAAKLNSVNLLLAAFDIQQLKVRDIIDAVPGLLTSGQCTSATLLASACASQLGTAVNDVNSAVTNLKSVETTLQNFSGQLTGNLTNPDATIKSLFKSNAGGGCSVNVLTNCDFYYTTSISMDASGIPTVDEYACKKVNNSEAGAWNVMSLFGPAMSFYAIGHTTAKLAPASDLLNTSTLGPALTQTFSLFPSVLGNAQVGSLLGLNVNAGSYGPVATLPIAPQKLGTICPF